MSAAEVGSDHRVLATRAVRLMLAFACAVAVLMVALRRADALTGLAAGTAVGVADVFLLSRSLTRFGGGAAINPRALGVGMLTRFLCVGVLLGLVLSTRLVNPLGAIVGFLLMPAAVAVTGQRWNRATPLVDSLDAGR